jgi:type 1 fimbriae regulatory protein FimB/type 1 fimbriae regulatory protein FimE
VITIAQDFRFSPVDLSRQSSHSPAIVIGYALANKGHDTRALQAYLGHKNIQHTVRYTELSPIPLAPMAAVKAV